MGRGTSICFYHSLRACVPFISCVKLCVELYSVCFFYVWDVDLVVVEETWYRFYLWLNYLWGKICIGIIFYSHSQGMVVNTFINPSISCFLSLQMIVSLFISCLILFVASSPICGFHLICVTCLICTHLGGDAICHMIWSIYFANPSVVI